MLFHFSFYSNEHPSLPAAGHEPAVEPGRHHLSRVKFPKSAVAQSPLSVSGLVVRSLRLGLGATQANLVPALCVQAIMVGLVFAYFYAPVVGLKLRKPTSANASNNSTMSRPPITGPKPPYQWLSENERYTWTKTPRPFRLGWYRR